MAAPLASTSHSAHDSIKALDPAYVHKISSGQVVVDLQTAVKELVENSLDAGSTSIGASLLLAFVTHSPPPTQLRSSESFNMPHTEVRFKDYGLESFDVIDNGSGIPAKDYDHIGT